MPVVERPWRRWAAIGALATGLATGPATAQLPLTAPKPAAEEPVEVVPLQELSNTLHQVEREWQEASTEGQENPRAVALAHLKRLLQDRIALREGRTRPSEEMTKRLPKIPELGDRTPPYPLSVLDDLRHARRARQRALEKYATLAEADESEFSFAQKRQAAVEQAYRALLEDKAPVTDRRQQLTQLQLNTRVAEQETAIQQLRLRNTRAAIRALEADIETIRDQVEAVGDKVQFTRDLYRQALFRLDQRQTILTLQQEEARLQLLRAETVRPGGEVPIDLMRTLRSELEMHDERLQLIPRNRIVWQHRYELWGRKTQPASRLLWCEEAHEEQTLLERRIRLRRLQQDQEAESARDTTGDDGVAGEPAGLSKRRIEALDAMIAALQRSLDLSQNLLDDHELLYGKDRSAAALWLRMQTILKRIWTFEIAASDDRPITVRKVVFAIFLILIGLKLGRLFSHSVVNRVLGRFRVEESVVSSISTLLFYVLAVLVVITAIGVANIPLTVFAFVGGAVAIGVGFGSQNIINNFISGIILLVERPIRKGDMVDVGGTYGKVDRVGLRCTQVRSFNNVDIMVPNSSFLESNVVNWTLTDDRVRGELFLGAVYGSPTERVRELMLQAAAEHDKILKSPAPEVMFMDFGDNALIFRLYAWVRMRSPSDRDRVLSDLRFRIDAMFRAENIVIAFPQRDVHLDTSRPLEVKMVRDEDDGTPHE